MSFFFQKIESIQCCKCDNRCYQGKITSLLNSYDELGLECLKFRRRFGRLATDGGLVDLQLITYALPH